MAFVTYSDEQDEWGYLREATFGTAQAVSANFRKVKFPKGTKVELPVVLSDLDLNKGTRQQVNADLHLDNFSGPVRVTVGEFVLELNQAADFLYACLQNRASQGAATAYAKVFKYHLTQQDFTANAGYFFTLAWKSPISANGVLITSCVVKELTISFDKTGTGAQNLVKISNMVILGKKHAVDQTLSGTWVDPGTSYFNSYDFTFKDSDSSTLPILNCSIKMDNGAESQDRDTDGTPKTWFLNFPKGGQMAEFKTWHYAATVASGTTDLTANFNAGTEKNFSIINSIAVGTAGNLKFNWYGKIVSGPPIEAQNRQLIIPVTMQMGHNSVATNNALIVSISDSDDQDT